MLRTGVSGRKRRKSTGDQNVEKPSILSSSLRFQVKRDETICLPCQLERRYTEPKNKILTAWEKDGSTIKPVNLHYTRENDCLRIRNITSYDHGVYKCNAYNRLGISSAVRILIVTDRLPVSIPPVLPTVKSGYKTRIPFILRDTINVVQPLSQVSIAIGRKMKLRCLVKGDPSPVVYWMFNGKKVFKTRKYLLRQGNYTLVIKKFLVADAGNYTCYGTNAAGKVSMTYLVGIKRRPPPSPTPPVSIKKKINVYRGENVTLTCRAPAKDVEYLIWKPQVTGKGEERGYRRGDLTRSMYKNGSRVQKSILINVTKEVHQGVYKCVGLFYRKVVATVKIVEVVVSPGPPSPPDKEGKSNGNKFLLNVVLPAACVAFFLLVLFFCICFLFRQMLRQPKGLLMPIQPPPAPPPTQSLREATDDQANMQILPMCHYNSLKINNKANAQHRTSTHSSTEHIEYKLSTSITLNPSIQQQMFTSSSSLHENFSPTTCMFNSTSNETSPPLSVPLIDSDLEDSNPYKEDQRLLLECANTSREKISKSGSDSSLCQNELYSIYDSINDTVHLSSTKTRDNDNTPRKMKKWESLIRSSCPSNVVETRIEEKLRLP